MTNALISLQAHLQPLLSELRPVEAALLPWREALGLAAARPLTAPRRLPSSAVALRSGHAVCALELAGASPQAPAPLAALPPAVAAGDAMPSGCDAILDPAALQVGRFGAEALEPVEPGAWVRLEGQDLAEGETLVEAGGLITPEIALAGRIAGVREIAVRRPRVRIERSAGPERDWLIGKLAACGAWLVEAGDGPADLLLRVVGDERPKLALAPGGAGWARIEGDRPIVELPARFDAMLGAWCALALPMLARLSGREILTTPTPLARKVSSAVGWTDLALLRIEEGRAHPLAVGDAPLGCIIRASGFAILLPESEGAPADAPVQAISLDSPFDRARSTP